MRASRLTVQNFRGIQEAELHFQGHTLLIGGNNVGKSTICEALDLALSPERLNRNPPVEEFDFRNANYLAADGSTPVPIRVEVVLTDLSAEIQRLCALQLEFWHKDERRLLGVGEIAAVDGANVEPCLRVVAIAKYDPEEDQFFARTVYAHAAGQDDEAKTIPPRVKRSIGFLYLRALRTGSRALSLERGTLLDVILRLKEVRSGLWERLRKRMKELDPPIDEDASELRPILQEIETRVEEYISAAGADRATRLFVSQLTREHLRKTIAFFLTMGKGEVPIPFQEAGTGTLNILVLALLTIVAEIKKDNVIFAMEEPEIALPPHTQRRVVNYLLANTTQSFVTSHSPYVIERFEPGQIVRLSRDDHGILKGQPLELPESLKSKTYRSQLRRGLAEAILGRGVIVGEGRTEQDMLLSAASKLESADSDLFALDLAGVTIINTDGEGTLHPIGAFFTTLDIPAFAFFDRKNRKAEDLDKIRTNFVVAKQTDYTGAERLMAAETPLDRQWQFLESLRPHDPVGKFGIPAARPDDNTLRELTVSTLKGLKGEGGSARLIDMCDAGEVPVTITGFLREVYARFPKPERRPAAGAAPAEHASDETAAATAVGEEPETPSEDSPSDAASK